MPLIHIHLYGFEYESESDSDVCCCCCCLWWCCAACYCCREYYKPLTTPKNKKYELMDNIKSVCHNWQPSWFVVYLQLYSSPVFPFFFFYFSINFCDNLNEILFHKSFKKLLNHLQTTVSDWSCIYSIDCHLHWSPILFITVTFFSKQLVCKLLFKFHLHLLFMWYFLFCFFNSFAFFCSVYFYFVT